MFSKQSKTTLLSSILIITLTLCVIGLVLAGGLGYEYREKLITAKQGGQIGMSDGTKLDIPGKCLAENTLITMKRFTVGDTGIYFEFGPHGITFNNRKNKSVKVELSWATLQDVNPDELVLYYFNEDLGEWVVETTAEFKNNEKKAVLYLDHFSKYYYDRR